jgi:hypothetical protein
MIDSISSKDRSSHIDRLIQLARRAVRVAQQHSRELGVANVYSINGQLFYEKSNGELSLTKPSGRTQGQTNPSP